MALDLPSIGETGWGPKLQLALNELAGSATTAAPMRVSGGYIQYQDRATSAWINLVALADLSGSSGSIDASAYGIMPTYYFNGSTWPARKLPPGYTGPVIWDSAGYSTVTTPPSAQAGDRWRRRKGSVATTTIDQFDYDTTEPTALNTGLGIWGPSTGLTVKTGDYRIASNTDVVENLDIQGRLIVNSGVTVGIIQNCKVRGSTVTDDSNGNTVDTSSAANQVTIRGCDIGDPAYPNAYKNGLGRKNFLAYRNNIHHVVDGVRINDGVGGTGALKVEAYGNYIHDLLFITPDSDHPDDLHTHSDGFEIESGTGYKVHGNAIWSYHSTDGSSNVTYVKPVVVNGTTYYQPAASTDAGAIVHPQTTSCIMLATYPSFGGEIYKNWFYGAEIQVNAGSSSNDTTTATIWGNRHERRNTDGTAGSWFSGDHTIDIDATATDITTGSGTTANVYMDNSAAVTVRRNA